MVRAEPWHAVLDAPFCRLGIFMAGDAVARIEFLLPGDEVMQGGKNPSQAVNRLARALDRYWRDPHADFSDVPRVHQGTAFRQRVWQTLTAIPSGRTLTYGEISARLGSSPRAVGQACGDNPLPILVPCHRVVARSSAGEFMHRRAGAALDCKAWLLTHERNRHTD